MKRAIYTKEDEDERRRFFLDTCEYCATCGLPIPDQRRKFCNAACKDTFYKIEGNGPGFHNVTNLALRRRHLDCWTRRNKYRNEVYKQAVRLFPHLKLKPDGITKGAWRYRVYKLMVEYSPSLKRKFSI